MAKRKPIKKSIRFEVFKRDKFTCQYCGAKSPDVILEIDHVIPVAKGGENSLLNFLTACQSCNSGKRDKLLSDDSLVDKQRKQIEELQERKNQIEMMLEWKLELSKPDEAQDQKVIQYINSKSDQNHLSEKGEMYIKELIRTYDAAKVINAVDESFTKYYKGTGNKENYEFALDKIKSILYMNSLTPEKRAETERLKESMRRVKNKFYHNYDYRSAWRAANHFISAGNTPDELDNITANFYTFSDWQSYIYQS